jgi:carboxyl-terminal processing protease
MSQTTKSGYKIWEPLLLAIVAVVGMIAGSKMATKSHGAPGTMSSTNAGQIGEIVRFVEEQYVDEINSGELVENAIESILGELDPHSGYFSPKELLKINEKMAGHFDGIGVQFHVLRDTIVILFVNPGGPADQAGMIAHDRVVTADGSSVVGPDKDESAIIEQLRGKKGSTVQVEVLRRGVDSLVSMDIVRDEIAIESVLAGYMLDESTGYIKLSRFSSTTYREFMSSLEVMVEEQGATNLVIDLRDNPGGYLKEAVNILSQLFDEKGKLLVYTEGEHAKRMDYKTTGIAYYKIENLVVLINGGTASASEIIAGAIQDHDRGVIVGTKSYGKGLVQEQYPLNNGGALRLTVARYYTPSGRCIQRPYESELAIDSESDEELDSTIFKTSYGRVVEADGGIDPDIEVPARYDWYDESVYVSYSEMLDYLFYGFETVYQDHHVTLEAYLRDFPTSEELKNDYTEYASLERDGEDFDQFEADWDRVYTMLKAMAASYRFGYDAWYRVVNDEDPVIIRAMEIVKEDLRTTLKI